MHHSSASPFVLLCLSFSFIVTNFSCSLCAVTKRPKLKSRYKDRVEATMKHTKTIDNFDDLVDSQTLACPCLNPEPSDFVLQAIAIKEKSEYYHISSSSPFCSLFFFFIPKCFPSFLLQR